jgi:Sec-independent protein translocase protein TatA
MGRSLGRGMREFKNSVTGDHHDDDVRPELLTKATTSTNGTRKPTARTRKPAARKRTAV